MSGRPPKPTRLKILEGNRGRRTLNDREPHPTSGIPTRPEFLLPEAKRTWVRLSRELNALGLLTKVDRETLATYCESWALYVRAAKAIEGASIEDAKDAISLMVKMGDKLATFGGKLGLSPSDRVRLAVPEKPHDDLEQMLRGESVQ
jgi:P27 family predicted phage terminase small subunit